MRLALTRSRPAQTTSRRWWVKRTVSTAPGRSLGSPYTASRLPPRSIRAPLTGPATTVRPGAIGPVRGGSVGGSGRRVQARVPGAEQPPGVVVTWPGFRHGRALPPISVEPGATRLWSRDLVQPPQVNRPWQSQHFPRAQLLRLRDRRQTGGSPAPPGRSTLGREIPSTGRC